MDKKNTIVMYETLKREIQVIYFIKYIYFIYILFEYDAVSPDKLHMQNNLFGLI